MLIINVLFIFKEINSNLSNYMSEKCFYFLHLIPDEGTYGIDGNSIKYDIKLKKVEGSILQWFKKLWAITGNEQQEEFVKESLGDIPFGLPTVYMNEFE